MILNGWLFRSLYVPHANIHRFYDSMALTFIWGSAAVVIVPLLHILYA